MKLEIRFYFLSSSVPVISLLLWGKKMFSCSLLCKLFLQPSRHQSRSSQVWHLSLSEGLLLCRNGYDSVNVWITTHISMSKSQWAPPRRVGIIAHFSPVTTKLCNSIFSSTQKSHHQLDSIEFYSFTFQLKASQASLSFFGVNIEKSFSEEPSSARKERMSVRKRVFMFIQELIFIYCDKNNQ